MNVDLKELRAKVEKEVKELEERKVALQEQLAHVEAVEKFAEELGSPGEGSEDTSSGDDKVTGFREEDQRKEMFGQSFG